MKADSKIDKDESISLLKKMKNPQQQRDASWNIFNVNKNPF